MSEAAAPDAFGLSRTPDYARRAMRAYAPEATDEVLDKRVELRQTRQQRLMGRSLAAWAVIDEAALRRVVGDADAHTAQLDHLLALAALPDVTVQVLPFRRLHRQPDRRAVLGRRRGDQAV
ncbi:DUF5753 domain-containing protein [Saccharothrix sp. SC076]|nr:Scr1 family TA system antitoxin-like transcriptional regulator [Saccharothrix obliqua]MBW4720114.1 DUF5753 domain-containing protein [Saccharothrix obliqua]